VPGSQCEYLCAGQEVCQQFAVVSSCKVSTPGSGEDEFQALPSRRFTESSSATLRPAAKERSENFRCPPPAWQRTTLYSTSIRQGPRV